MKDKRLIYLMLSILIGILIFSSIKLVNAETEIYPINQNVDLKFTCTLNNAIPSASTQYNITISYPNGSTFKNNQNTTPLGSGAFNYTTNFTVLGLHKVQMFCYDETYSFSDEGYYNITPLGNILSTSQSIIYFIFLLASVGIFFLCLYYSFKIEWTHVKDEEGYVIGVNDLKYIKIFAISMAYVMLLFIMGLLRSITANYIPEIEVYKFFEVIYWLMLMGLYPIVVCSLIFALIIFVSNKKLQKAIDLGVPIQ